MKCLTGLLIIVTLLFPFTWVKTGHAQPGVVWTTQFFNNPDLAGTPVLTRTDTSIAFDWGTGSPAPGVVAADSFSARFASSVYFPAGSYQFTVLADDGVKLFVAGTLLIDSFEDALHGQMLTATVMLSTGNHVIQLDYREATREAFVYLDWGLAGTPSNLPSERLWLAEYFNNQTLSGAPVYTATEPSPTHFWQADAPVNTIPADNWSARWTSVQTLRAGTYRISVRADDGVRVYVDGIAYIDEWHEASGQTYVVDVNLNAGQHTFVIDFYENQGLAYLEYKFENVTTLSPATGTFVEITAYALRVRSEPNTITGKVLTQVQAGQVYPVLGRSTDGNWWQINANGTVGWVHGAYVTVTGAEGLPDNTPPSGTVARVTPTNLNMRYGPGITFAVRAVLPRGTIVRVDGRDSPGDWLHVTVNGMSGWISSQYAALQTNTSIFQLPVVS